MCFIWVIEGSRARHLDIDKQTVGKRPGGRGRDPGEAGGGCVRLGGEGHGGCGGGVGLCSSTGASANTTGTTVLTITAITMLAAASMVI